jgi:FlgD Ig-like domain
MRITTNFSLFLRTHAMNRTTLNSAQILTSCALAVVLIFVVNSTAHTQTLNIITKTSTVQIRTADIDSATVQTTTFTIVKKDKTTQVIAIADIQRMTFTLATGVVNTSNSAALSGLLGLVKAFPNPASSMSAIEYELAQPASVEARIVDAAGNLVKTIVMGMQQTGTHEIQWDATNSAGLAVANASYTCVIRTSSGAMLTQKLVIIR